MTNVQDRCLALAANSTEASACLGPAWTSGEITALFLGISLTIVSVGAAFGIAIIADKWE